MWAAPDGYVLPTDQMQASVARYHLSTLLTEYTHSQGDKPKKHFHTMATKFKDGSMMPESRFGEKIPLKYMQRIQCPEFSYSELIQELRSWRKEMDVYTSHCDKEPAMCLRLEVGERYPVPVSGTGLPNYSNFTFQPFELIKEDTKIMQVFVAVIQRQRI